MNPNKPNPEQWVKNYADYLYRYATIRLVDYDLCKDLVQETFLSGIKNLNHFKGISSEKTWLTSILKNKIIDHYRNKATDVISNNSILTEDHTVNFFEQNGHWKKKYEPIDWGIKEPEFLENEELKNILQSCIRKLPQYWAMIFSMRYLDEENSENICKEMNITPSNFWVIIHRAKLNLRACISKHWLK